MDFVRTRQKRNKNTFGTYPRILNPAFWASRITARARSSPSATEQFVFALLNPSLALTNTATSLTPCCIASLRPRAFGIRTGSCRRSFPRIDLTALLDSSVRASANCGICFGETRDVNSMVRRPAARSREIRSIFVDVGTCCLMFCSPSRGPTSTMRTAGGVDSTLMVPGIVQFRVKVARLSPSPHIAAIFSVSKLLNA